MYTCERSYKWKLKMGKPVLQELWRITGEIMGELELYLQQKTGEKIKLRYRPEKQARLLKLRVWSTRYRVPVGEVLEIILPVLRGRVPQNKLRRHGIGVGVYTFVGRKAEEILKDELRRKYPDSEHLTLWREQERERQLERERTEDLEGLKPHRKPVVSLLESESMEDFLTGYRDSIQQEKSQQDRVQTETWRKRKAYRGNPWR